MTHPLAIALTLGALVYVVLLMAASLTDPAATQRARRLLRLSQNPSAFPWRTLARALLTSTRPPALLSKWVDGPRLERAAIAFSPEDLRAGWYLGMLLCSGAAMGLVGLGRGGAWVIALAVAMLGIAALGPPVFLRWRTARRARALTRSLPDFLDLLTLSVEAGQGFEAAFRRVLAAYPGPLGDELRLAMGQMDLGHSRAAALRALAHRAPSPDVRSFVAAVIQAEQPGTSLARTLRIQADLLRTRRRQRAQAAAQTTPIRIVPALVFFFLPALLLIYLAPPVLNFLFRR